MLYFLVSMGLWMLALCVGAVCEHVSFFLGFGFRFAGVSKFGFLSCMCFLD